ncbi:MAG: hypothetical protein JWP52_3627 [Rhizobacter sp.]|nr:hypothetical protein [Rhizobacter sp.]
MPIAPIVWDSAVYLGRHSQRLTQLLSPGGASIEGGAIGLRQELIGAKVSLVAMNAEAASRRTSAPSLDLPYLQAQLRAGYEKVEELLASHSPTASAVGSLRDRLDRLMPFVTAEAPAV